MIIKRMGTLLFAVMLGCAPIGRKESFQRYEYEDEAIATALRDFIGNYFNWELHERPNVYISVLNYPEPSLKVEKAYDDIVPNWKPISERPRVIYDSMGMPGVPTGFIMIFVEDVNEVEYGCSEVICFCDDRGVRGIQLIRIKYSLILSEDLEWFIEGTEELLFYDPKP